MNTGSGNGARSPSDIPTVCMVVYTDYRFDARVKREAETLAKSGYRVVCIVPRLGTSCSTYVHRGVEVRELRVRKYRGKKPLAYLASYLCFLCDSSVATATMLLNREINIIHVHNMPNCLVLAGLAPRLFGKKVILDIHDNMPEMFASKFRNRSSLWSRLVHCEERLSTLVAHTVICPSLPQKEVLVEHGVPSAKIFVSMNVPDSSIFDARTCLKQPPQHEDFNLVYHGTMAKRLGIDLIIRAVRLLSDQIPNLHLHLWGNGDDLPEFQELTRVLNMTAIVHFEPEGVPVEELPGQLRLMDVGVVGNRRSPATELMLPVKLLEYVALGIPVVAPELRTIRSYFTPEMVSYFQPGSADSMAAALLKLCESREKRQAQVRAAASFLELHGWEKQGPELLNLYAGLLLDNESEPPGKSQPTDAARD